MLTWERKKYLAKGHYISEEAEIKSNQRIMIEYFIRPGNTNWEARAHYFIADERIKFFLLEDVSSIEAVRAEAFKRVHDYVEDKICYWNDKLLKMWQEESWEDDVDETVD